MIRRKSKLAGCVNVLYIGVILFALVGGVVALIDMAGRTDSDSQMAIINITGLAAVIILFWLLSKVQVKK